tara:strand:+ start:398 stop:1369 length:972 start_codon:yes stop_codon:yes gene_type:complete
MKYLLVDTANLFFRARHVVRGDLDTKTGMCLHIIFQAINSIYRKFDGQVVFFFEGRSWRKDYYKQYKLNRKELRDSLTEKEAKEEKIFWQTFDDFFTFLYNKTNCIVCQHDNLEADDLIAGWIKNHSTDEHVIVSSDSDFYQLIDNHVSQYNSITDTLINNTGHFIFRTMKPVLNKKTKESLSAPDPEWILFEKCMRGDSTDNIFSAYPGVRTKGSKNKIGLLEAFADKDKKGYAWNNLMLQRWVDHEGQEHRVLDCYNRNKMLIDLNAQPADIKIKIDECISTSKVKEQVSQVGIHLMRFCGKHNLVKIGEQVNDHVKYLNK